ncbi:MAG: WD40 repeat domain-containing protein [Planctomycetes bacterium]|nr:WD40 repeat domain-containing protein [Planctomycetota bacterium]
MKRIWFLGLVLALTPLASAEPTVVGRLAGHKGTGVSVVRYSPNYKQALTASSVGEIKLWDLAKRKVVHTMTNHKGISDLVFTADGKGAFSSGYDGEVRLWNLEEGRLERAYSGHSKSVLAVALDSSGTRVASCGLDKTVRVWDVASGKALHVLQHKTVKVWDVAKGTVLASLEHTDLVRCLSLSRNGLLLTGDESDRATLWDLKTRKLLSTWVAHKDSGVFSVALDKTGGRALTGGVDSAVVKVWQLQR